MYLCPVCRNTLSREEYEGTLLWRCLACRGVLLSRLRLEIIKHRRQKDDKALQEEAKLEFTRDTVTPIRCPQCAARMGKAPIARRYMTLTLDVCPRCDSVWLDGGELALVQAIFEASVRGRESQAFQQRMQALGADPDRKARFEEAMAKLPEHQPFHRNDDLIETLLTMVLRHRP